MMIRAWIWCAMLAFTAAVGAAKHVMLERAHTEIAELHQSIAEANAKAAEQALALQQKVTEAQNEAKKREALLRAAADAVRGESDGLRHDIDALRGQLANATRDAAVERAAAVAELFGQCARRYSDVAEKAQRHADDVKMLIEAWPR